MFKFIPILLIILSISASSLSAKTPDLPNPMDEQFFYQIGAGTDFRVSAGIDTPKDLMLARDFMLLLGDGSFDPAASIKASLQGLVSSFTGAFQKKVKSLVNVGQITSSVTQLPGYVLCQANPTMCQLTENYTLRAEERERYQRKFLNEIENEMGQVRGQLDGWLQAAKSDYLVKVMNDAKKTGEKDLEIVTGKIRDFTGATGMKWLGGQMAGGNNQPPIRPIADTAKAGFNMLLGRTVTTGSRATGTDPLLDYWDTPEELGKWLTEVVGEYRPDLNNVNQQRTISANRTGNDDGDLGQGGEDVTVTQAFISQDISTPAMGLAPKVKKESALIQSKLQTLVNSSGTPTTAELTQMMGKSSSVVLTPQLIKIIRNSPMESVLIKQISDDAAIANTVRASIEARRALLAGRNETHIASYEVAKKDIDTRSEQLSQYIDDLLYEHKVSQELLTGQIDRIYAYANRMNQQYGRGSSINSSDIFINGGKAK